MEMIPESQKLKRMEYIAEMLQKCMFTEPRLTEENIAEVLAEMLPDIEGFLRKYIKEKKKA